MICTLALTSLTFIYFADDNNLFRKHRSLSSLQAIINGVLINVNSWLCTKKLSLNVEKSSFVVFHPPQREIIPNFDLTINGNYLKRYFCIKYLGVLIDSNLSWKPQVDSIIKKIKRSIGILSKLRYYVNITILINLYYSLIYPFLTCDLLSWGNAYTTTLQPLYILQ